MTLVTHELRIADNGAGQGNLLVAVALPEGEELAWDAPSAGAQMPDGLPPVELYLDGVLAAVGRWPNLVPVDSG